ncbi:MAG: hypothetical protein JW781_08630, partial [Deltaproteobacteria bacterium]|nr:hypothetical protein [Candidatus Anaeroferrophillacea bacterium]
ARVLKPGGVLIVGGAESLAMMGDRFQARHYLQGIYYQVPGSDPAAPSERPLTVPLLKPSPGPAAAARPPRAAMLRPAPKPAKGADFGHPTVMPTAPAGGNIPAGEAPKRRPEPVSEPIAEPVPVVDSPSPPVPVVDSPPVAVGAALPAAASVPSSPAGSFLATAGGDAVTKPSLLGRVAADRPAAGLLGCAGTAAGGGDSLLRRLSVRRDERQGGAEVFPGIPGMDNLDDDYRDRAAVRAGDAAGAVTAAAGAIEDAASGRNNVGADDHDTTADGDDDKVRG